MSDDKKMDSGRRNLLVGTAVLGGAATAVAAWPFGASMLPSESAKAAGAPVEVDISQLAPGDKLTVAWRGQPVWVLRRTKEMLESLPKLDDKVSDPKSEKNPDELTPAYARNEHRSIKPEYLVVVGICSHLGCSPSDKFAVSAEPFDANWQGGFYCPCHGSLFDLAGRVFKNKPAPDNLRIPPYTFLSATSILIGVDTKGA